MLTLLLALAVLGAIGLALGRAPLHRLLVSTLAVLLYLPLAALWIAVVFGLLNIERVARKWGWSDERSWAALALIPPVMLTFLLLRRLARRSWPRFVWTRAHRPPVLAFGRILVVQALVVAACIAGGNTAASFRERAAERTWAAVRGASAPASRPGTTNTNAAGLELSRLAAGVGMEVGREHPQASPEDRRFHERVRRSLSSFAWSAVSRTDSRLPPAPLDVRAWLAMSADGLEAVERHLVGGQAVAWELPPDDSQEVFPLLDLRDLHSALVVSALERIRTDMDGAPRALEAAWRLTASLRDRPNTASRLLATALDRQVLGLLRLAGSASPAWEERLGTIDDRLGPFGATAEQALSLVRAARKPWTTARGMFIETYWVGALLDGRSFQAGGLFLALSGGRVSMENAGEAIEAERARARTPFYRITQGLLERPYLRLCAADYAAALAQEYSAAVREDACAGPQPETRSTTPRLAAWNIADESGVSLRRMSRNVAVLRDLRRPGHRSFSIGRRANA
jgi:hypothetical protein